jgi:hypothetical protein
MALVNLCIDYDLPNLAIGYNRHTLGTYPILCSLIIN